MKTRNSHLESILEKQIGEVSINSSKEEVFQNKIIRPILKFQNDLILKIFIEYCIKQKSVFFKLSVNKKLEYIEHSLQRDMKFREFYKGIVIGLFNTEAFEEYSKNSSNLNRRIITMLIERLKSQVQLLVLVEN